MNSNLKDPRVLGIGGAVLLALTTLLPWSAISVPMLGQISVNGLTDDEGLRPDGFVALALAAGIALTAWRGKWRIVAILAGLFAAGYLAEYVYALFALRSAKAEIGGGEFGEAIADSITLSPGIGLIGGALLAVGLTVLTVLSRRTTHRHIAPEAVPA
jgi:hypothetical protein